MSVERRLAALGLELPPPPPVGGTYDAVVLDDGLAYVSGQIAMRDGELVAHGTVGADVDLETARDCARTCALNALAALAGALEDRELARLERVVKLTVFVASTPDFDQHPTVADAASQLLAAVLGDAGSHARSAVGVAALPHGTPVELEAVVRMRPSGVSGPAAHAGPADPA